VDLHKKIPKQLTSPQVSIFSFKNNSEKEVDISSVGAQNVVLQTKKKIDVLGRTSIFFSFCQEHLFVSSFCKQNR